MKIFILDAYSPRPYRVSKDTNGGFGTVNDFGNAAFPKILSWIKKQTVDFPSLYLPYLAAQLKRQGHQVTYGRNRMPDADHDLVLMPSSIVEHSEELRWGRKIRDAGVPVGFLGPFAGVVPDRYLEAGTFVLCGEPEAFFSRPQDLGTLKGVIMDYGFVNPDEAPLPDWEPFGSQFLQYRLYGGGGRFLPMIASRGCPFPCRYYCTYPLQQGKTVRRMSAKRIVDEMQYLKETYSVRKILFRDPIFSLDRKATMEFAKELIARELNLSFIIETHLNCLDPELAAVLRQAGLVTAKVGVESGNLEVMKKFNRKNFRFDEQIERIRAVERLGIQIIAFYILAMPDDTIDTALQTIRYSRLLNTAGAQYSVATPYPGTKFYDDIKDNITAERFDDYTHFDLVMRHKNLSAADVTRLKNIAYSSYYLRPRWLAKYLKSRVRTGPRVMPVAPTELRSEPS